MNQEINQLIQDSKSILIIQADNPDGDSLGSALALERILSKMDKQTYLYCGIDMPGYLRHMRGWNRVSSDLPANFDLSIIVDASTMTLLDKLVETGKQGIVASKPVIVLDHHQTVENEIPFARVILNNPGVSSTGELIYTIAKDLQWPLDSESGSFIMSAVLGDTQGLTNQLTKADTYRLMAELTELGVDRPALEELRRESSKMPKEIFSYKAKLIDRTSFEIDGKLAMVHVPHAEIMEFSPLYNPAPLIQNDMLQTAGVGIAVVIKTYNDGKVLGAIRCNAGYAIGAELAEHFGGGGHPYASGFKLQDGRSYQDIRTECISVVTGLIDKLKQDKPHEDSQYAYQTD